MSLPVLLVEDDSEVRESIQAVLEFEGFTVKTAPDGVDALKLLQTGFKAQVILVDIMMPIMTGKQFIESYRAEMTKRKEEPAPIVILSAGGDVQQVSKTLGVAYLPKPVELDDLVSTVSGYYPPGRP